MRMANCCFFKGHDWENRNKTVIDLGEYFRLNGLLIRKEGMW